MLVPRPQNVPVVLFRIGGVACRGGGVSEVGRVGRVLELWHPRRRVLALQEATGVEFPADGMAIDVLFAARERPQPPRRIGLQQLGDEICSLGAHLWCHGVPARLDLSEDGPLVTRRKGRAAVQHLVCEDPQGPPVDGTRVPLAAEDLGATR